MAAPKTRRFDFEKRAASILAAYLQAAVDAPIQAQSPIVTFFDPMSVDESHRIIVFCPAGETMIEDIGNFDAQLEIGVKSEVRQATMQQDIDDHFDRVDAVRDKLWSPTIIADCSELTVLTVAGKQVSLKGAAMDFVQPKRGFTTEMRQGWAYSETTFIGNFRVTDN